MTICKRCVFFKDIVFIWCCIHDLQVTFKSSSPNGPPKKIDRTWADFKKIRVILFFLGGVAKLGVSNLPRSWGGGWLSEMRVIASCQWWPPQHLRCWLIQVANRSCGRPECRDVMTPWMQHASGLLIPYWSIPYWSLLVSVFYRNIV